MRLMVRMFFMNSAYFSRKVGGKSYKLKTILGRREINSIIKRRTF
jgi:hypothetical protein